MRIICKVLLLLLIQQQVAFASETKSQLVKSFNDIAKINLDGGNTPAIIELQCGFVTESIAFIKSHDDVKLVLNVNSEKYGYYSLSSATYGIKYPDDSNFENLRDEVGWEYFFNAPRGPVIVILYKNGKAETKVYVGSKKTKSTCNITSVLIPH